MPKAIRKIEIRGPIALVPLTQGVVAVVDAADAHLVSEFNWCAVRWRGGFYAKRKGRNGEPSTVLLHRVIMGATKAAHIDHRDGDGLNNRRVNLREATPGQNQHNARMRADNTSGRKGVSWSKRGSHWVAYITHRGKLHYLGSHTTRDGAHAVYAEAANRLNGDFARVD